MKVMTALTAVVAVLVVPAASSAAISQQAIVKVKSTAGALAPKGKNYVKVDAYLSTRDPASGRPQLKANPVSKAVLAFPPGSTINPKATPGCHLSQYSPVSTLKAKCAKALVGMGWAFVNTGWDGASARTQLADISGGPNSPARCADPVAPVGATVNQDPQYSATYEAAGVPGCVPVGHIWSRVYAYQGAIINGKYLSNGIIFANDNSVAAIAFGGTTKTNTLTVPLPALNGTGAGLGELPFGWVLSDFKLNITKTNYLKAGACTSSKKWTVKSTVSFSNFKPDGALPGPASQVKSTVSPCRP
ncbi:MAG: hypothetical protein F2799_04685 [Actinobacteria bacterium]|uniref:Unannotated protein n=1 Tax=freshwater metagenome TaxID=449393 RepID=A0A6J7DVD8_9ZZZZ|nr:hypothetical protein [Actinomycetota bacterium]